MKHVVLSLIAATALLTAGCGSKSSGRNLDTALSYVPKNAAVVVAIDTNPDGDQWQQVDHLLGKFPFGGRVKQQLKSAFTSRTKIHYDKVIKPLLGSDVVLAILGPRRPYTQIPYVLAWKLKDEAAAHRQLEANSGQAGTIDGLDVYGRPPTNFAVIKDGTLVIADTMPALEAA